MEDEKIQKILNLARKAPSAGFTQPVEFILIKDQEIKKALSEASLYQEQLLEASIIIAVVSNTSRSSPRYGKRGIEFYSVIDGAFASMIILLTCVNEGLGASFVGAFEDEKVSKVLKLPNYVRPIGLIAIGCPGESSPKYKRISLEKLIHENTW